MRGAMWLQHCWAGFMPLMGIFLVCVGVVLAEAPLSPPQQPRISETDVPPQSRPLTFSRLLDEYLTGLQKQLKYETKSIQESGLAEVKMTIRKDGALTFSEIVVLDGPAALRNELLPLVNQLGPFPPLPVDADMLAVSVLLPLQYPGPDLLDSIDPQD